MNTMRKLINLYEQFRAGITEAGAGPSRVMRHIHQGNVFIMLSAMRGNVSHVENLRRTDKLNKMLAALPVSYIATEGEYHEDGQPEPLPEKSFFVMPRKGDSTVTAGPFRDFGTKLMATFDQDSILYGDGKTVSLITNDGQTFDLGDTLTFRPDVISGLEGHSKIKGRQFSFTDATTASKPASKAPDATSSATKGVTYGAAAPRDARGDNSQDAEPRKKIAG